jgi:hypothetical protein
MPFPYPLERVPGAQALATLAQLQSAGRGIPILLGEEEALGMMAEIFDDAEDSVDDLILAARAIDVPAWLQARAAELEEDGDEDGEEEDDIEESEWPDVDTVANDQLSVHKDILTNEPHAQVVIALIPAAESWMVPCYLRAGGWNECPAAEEQAAVFKYWEEKYGATLACVSSDVIELQVARPPQTREDALALAREQYIFCTDIVEQGTGTVEALAATLLNGRVWYFWWD